jgi:hypothetical protein
VNRRTLLTLVALIAIPWIAGAPLDVSGAVPQSNADASKAIEPHGAGGWVPGAGCRVPGAGGWVPGAGCRVPGADGAT